MTASAGPVLKRLHEEFGDRVAFVTLYTREAHPGERYPQPDTFEQKLEHARAYRERDEIPWRVAVDDLEGSVHQALDPKPNAAYLMNIQGNAAFRSLWSNDERILREALQAIMARPSALIGERLPRVVPMLSGMGRIHDILDSAGSVAKRDFLREAPPMYAMARLAALFGPLPPLGRGSAAVASSAVGLTVALIGLRRMIKRMG